MSAPYYPRVELTQSVTRFGAIESSNPTLYKSPIQGKIIYEIDTLTALQEIWGANILQARENVYKIVSGSCSDDEYRLLLRSYYRKYAAFTNYINGAFLFGDRATPEIERIVIPARRLIDAYADNVMAQLRETGAKFLMHTHDYIYCAYPQGTKNKAIWQKVVAIC